MLVVLKENLMNVDFERLLNIVRKYGIEMINGQCFELPNNVSLDDLDILQKDKAVDKIVVKAHVAIENILTTYGCISE